MRMGGDLLPPGYETRSFDTLRMTGESGRQARTGCAGQAGEDFRLHPRHEGSRAGPPAVNAAVGETR